MPVRSPVVALIAHNAMSKIVNSDIVTISGPERIRLNYDLEVLAKLIEVRCPDYTGPTLPQVSHMTLRSYRDTRRWELEGSHVS